jgi:NitT/TauT family transport system substrate-binding protein
LGQWSGEEEASSEWSDVMRLQLAVTGMLAVLFPSFANAADRVVFGLDYVPSGQHAPFYVAQGKGFFTANGLDVDMQRGYGSSDTVKRVAAGAFEIGFGDTGAVILSRAEGLKVKTFAMIYVKAPYTLIVRDDADIKTPKDLIGKTLAGPVGSATRTIFPLFARRAGIDPAGVNWLTTDAANLLPVLLSNRAAGVAEFYAGHATYLTKAEENGVKLHLIKYSDYGVDIYSNGLIARDQTIAERPDVLRRFVKAIHEAYVYTYAHPEEAAQILAEAQPHLTPKLILANIQAVKELNTPKRDDRPWGYIDRDMMIATREAAAEAYASENAKAVSVDECFTNEFVN